MTNIVLVAPEIPQNTGNIGRLCVATNTKLHLVEPLGFEINDKQLRRAGLDYWKHVNLTVHMSWAEFLESENPEECFLLTTKGSAVYTEVKYPEDAYLIFGSESKGLPQNIHDQFLDRRIKIPMFSEHIRSLNIANAASIVLYESIRQRS